MADDLPHDPFDPRDELRAMAEHLEGDELDDHHRIAMAERLREIADQMAGPIYRLPFQEIADGDAYDTISVDTLTDHLDVKGLLPGEIAGIGILRFVFGQGRDGQVNTLAIVDYAADPAGLRDLTRLINKAGVALARRVEGRPGV